MVNKDVYIVTKWTTQRIRGIYVINRAL